LGSLAIAGHLPPCDIDRLKKLEDDFSAVLLHADPSAVFTVIELADFQWAPKLRNDLIKTDVINKYAPTCN
jgi:acetolactate decarboxylase